MIYEFFFFFFKVTLSTVFKKMFTSDFKEKIIGEVVLHDKKLDDIMELLNVIYPHKSKEIEGEGLNKSDNVV